MKCLFIATAFVVVALPALAQQPQVDPRIAGPLVAAAKAEIGLMEAVNKALQDDMKRRESEWADYSKSLWQAPAVSEK